MSADASSFSSTLTLKSFLPSGMIPPTPNPFAQEDSKNFRPLVAPADHVSSRRVEADILMGASQTTAPLEESSESDAEENDNDDDDEEQEENSQVSNSRTLHSLCLFLWLVSLSCH